MWRMKIAYSYNLSAIVSMCIFLNFIIGLLTEINERYKQYSFTYTLFHCNMLNSVTRNKNKKVDRAGWMCSMLDSTYGQIWRRFASAKPLIQINICVSFK